MIERSSRRTCAIAAALLAAAAATAWAEDRPVRGELTYLQRIALPDDAEVVVELKDAAGTVVGEARTSADGRQVPLPFEVTGPAATALTFRGAVLADGRPAWISEAVPIEAGSEPVDLGAVRVQPITALAAASALVCGATEVVVGFDGERARLQVHGRTVDLAQVPAASGARYEAADDPGTFFWSRGERALVAIDGATLPECAPADAAPDLRARGNEPGWQLTVRGEGLRLVTDYGATWLETTRFEREATADGTRFTVPHFALAATVNDTLCRDDMTGMPHPGSVVLDLADTRLRGCAGEPLDLLVGDEWIVETIDGEPVDEETTVTLLFDAAGRLAGSSGCNRYTTDFQLTGEGLGFGLMAGTMMACPDPTMDQEQRFYRALEEVARFDVDDEGRLLLLGVDGERIVARR